MDEEKKEGVVSQEIKEETNTIVERQSEEKTESVIEAKNVTEEKKTEESVKEEVKQEPKVENITSKKGGKGNKAAIIVIIIAVLLILAAAGIFYYMNNMMVSADKVFKIAIDTCKEEYAKNINLDGAKTIRNEASMDVDINLMPGLIDADILNLINDIKLDVSAQIDVEKNNMAYNVKADKKDKELVNVDLYFTKDKLYAKLNELFDKYLYLEIDEEDIEVLDIDYEVMVENEKIVVDKLLTAISSSLKEEYFTQEKMDKIKKHTLVLNDVNIRAIIKDVVTALKDDEQFLSAIANLSNMEVSDIKEGVENILTSDESEPFFEEGHSLQIAIFTTGMKYEVTRITIESLQNEVIMFSFAADVVGQSQINYTFSSEEEKITGTFTMQEISSQEVKTTFSVKYGEYIDAKIDMTFKYSIDKSKNLELPNFSGAVDLEDIQYSDIQKILKNVQKNDALMDVVKMVNELTKDSDEVVDFIQDEDVIIFEQDDEKDVEDDEEDIKNDEKDADDNKVVSNVLEYEDYKIEFNKPSSEYILDEEYSSERVKYFDSKDDKVSVYLRIGYYDEEEYFENVKEHDYQYKIDDEDDFYKNVELSEVKEIKSGKNTMKYLRLTYEVGTTSEREEVFAIYEIDDDYAYIIEIETKDTEFPDELFEDLANFKIK